MGKPLILRTDGMRSFQKPPLKHPADKILVIYLYIKQLGGKSCTRLSIATTNIVKYLRTTFIFL